MNNYLIGAIVAGLSVLMWLIGTWQPLEQLGYNILFKIRQGNTWFKISWDDRITVIAIDEKTLNTYGRMSDWPRDRYVELLQFLASASPTAIGFDIIFSEPSSDDQEFAQEIYWSGNIILALGIDSQNQPLKVTPELSKVARNGHIVARSDTDGISRQALLFIGDIPSLGVALLQTHQQSINYTLQGSDIDKLAPITPLIEPNNHQKEQWVWINWPDTVKQLPTYSFVDVLEGKIEPRHFTNKIVLVGTTATGLDPLRTPFNDIPPTTGVYLQAVVIDNLLQNRLLYRLPLPATLLLLLMLPPVTIWALNKRNWQGRLITLGLLLLGWGLIALLSFCSLRGWLPTAAPIGTILLTATGLQLREQLEKQQLMKLFSQHVSTEMAAVIWQRRSEIFQYGLLKPQELEATVLFVDLRNFTAISESLAPQELLDWLNLYLETMSNCLMQHGGVIDKYMGDAIMAVFGVPFVKTKVPEIRQDALNAVAASISMHSLINQLNQRLLAQEKPLIEIGIGIHTGLVVVGSMGGSGRLNYSVLGDTVNIAARLEAMNKEVMLDCPYRILVSDRTFAYVSEQYLAEIMGAFQLKGKKTATTVYAIVGEKKE